MLLHNSMLLDHSSIGATPPPPIIVDPVVVNPLIDSKSASITSIPDRMNGSEPNIVTRIHDVVITNRVSVERVCSADLNLIRSGIEKRKQISMVMIHGSYGSLKMYEQIKGTINAKPT